MVKITDEGADSGMESLSESAKDITPEISADKLPALEDDYENEEDETLAERLVGLTEMFPTCLRNFSYKAGVGFVDGIIRLYGFSRSAAWVMFTTSAILVAPLVFETERIQVQTAQLNQQKQVLLGPSTVMGSGSPGGVPMMPPN